MRALRTAAVACVLMMLASLTTAYDALAQARAVQTRWQNCSQIVRGRMGAIYDDADQDNDVFVQQYFQALTYNGYTVSWSPCILSAAGNFLTATSSSVTYTFPTVLFPGTTTAATIPDEKDRLIVFTMPNNQNQVPTINITYQGTASTSATPVTVSVMASCNASTRGTLTAFNVTGDSIVMTIDTIYACARFPFTNESLPNGGIAALVVVLVLIAAEGLACAGYHARNKQHSVLEEETTNSPHATNEPAAH